MNGTKRILNTLFKILIISLITYAVMAVITHFSLHYRFQGYKFSQSLISVYDFNTDIFKFYAGFMIINAIWIVAAVIVYNINKIIRKRI